MAWHAVQCRSGATRVGEAASSGARPRLWHGPAQDGRSTEALHRAAATAGAAVGARGQRAVTGLLPHPHPSPVCPLVPPKVRLGNPMMHPDDLLDILHNKVNHTQVGAAYVRVCVED